MRAFVSSTVIRTDAKNMGSKFPFVNNDLAEYGIPYTDDLSCA